MNVWISGLECMHGLHAWTAGTDRMPELNKQNKNPIAHSDCLTHKEKAQ